MTYMGGVFLLQEESSTNSQVGLHAFAPLSLLEEGLVPETYVGNFCSSVSPLSIFSPANQFPVNE